MGVKSIIYFILESNVLVAIVLSQPYMYTLYELIV